MAENDCPAVPEVPKKESCAHECKGNDLDKKLPIGMPGRTSFVYFPREKKAFWRPEAFKLRQCFKVLGPLHLFFICGDLYVYQFEVFALIFDCVFLWLSYQNFMTLNKIT